MKFQFAILRISPNPLTQHLVNLHRHQNSHQQRPLFIALCDSGYPGQEPQEQALKRFAETMPEFSRDLKGHISESQCQQHFLSALSLHFEFADEH
jgi:hypothetical protein